MCSRARIWNPVQPREEPQIFVSGQFLIHTDAVAQDADALARVLGARILPIIVTRPFAAFDKPARIRSKVVLPAPLRPSNARQAPPSTLKLISRSAG